VIWLNIYKNIGRPLSNFSRPNRSERGAKGWIGITTVLAIVFAYTYGCEDFNPEKDSATKSQSGDSGTKTSSSTESDAGENSQMDAAKEETSLDASADSGKKAAKVLKDDFTVAQSSDSYIFIPNPQNHCVTIIDGTSVLKGEDKASSCLACDGDQCVGGKPTYMGVYAKKDIAIVTDKGTQKAAIIEKAPAASRITSIDVVKGANAIRFAPNGTHAIVYYDPDYVGDEQTDGYQEITVVTLTNSATKNSSSKTATNMIVGLRPRELVFQSDGTQAFFITDDGVSIINFTGLDSGDTSSAVAPTVDFKGLLDPSEAQIAIAPGGGYATGFKPGSDELYLLNLTAALGTSSNQKPVTSLTMDEFFIKTVEDAGSKSSTGDDAGTTSTTKPPNYNYTENAEDPRMVLPADVVPGITDVAISPATTGSYALVTIPKPGLVLKVNIPKAFTTTKNVLNEAEFYLVNEKYDRIVISSDGDKALLYNEESKGLRGVLLDLTGDAPPASTSDDWSDWTDSHVKHISFAYPITKAESLAGSKTILALHEPSTTAVSTTKRYGYSVVDLEKQFVKFQSTPTRVRSYFTFNKALFLAIDDNSLSTHQVYRTGLDDLLLKSIELKTKPIAMGALPGAAINSIFISQQHPDGYIVLYNDSGEAVTNPFVGFQIIDRVVQE
jgi:hypothetical protein